LPGTIRWPGRGGGKDQPPAARALLERELLRQRAAPGHAQHVDFLVSELVEQPRGQPRQGGGTVGQGGRRRAAHARHVEYDRRGPVERVEERLDQLDVGADAVEDEQRRARRVAAPDADPQRLPADFVQADLHPIAP
jgi:hypothetical protein